VYDSSWPEQGSGGEDEPGAVVGGVLSVSGGDAAPDLQAAEGAFDDVRAAVRGRNESEWASTLGFLMGMTIECPKHLGRFDIRTGEAQRLPAVRPPRSYPVRVEAGRVLTCPGVRAAEIGSEKGRCGGRPESGGSDRPGRSAG
jgi:hypothetical protein